MDINKLNTADAHQAGAEMQVKSEKGELLDCYITLVGVDSKTWRNISKKNRRKVILGEDVDNAKVALQSSDVASVLATLVDGGMQPQEAAATIIAAGGDTTAVRAALVAGGHATKQTVAGMMQTAEKDAGVLGFTPPTLPAPFVPAQRRLANIVTNTPGGGGSGANAGQGLASP